MKLNIIFEDDNLIVADKPTGLISTVSDTSDEITLQEMLREHSKTILENADKSTDFYKRAGLVHRLDKDTSGVIIAAKDKDSFDSLLDQFRQRSIQKQYLAVIMGELNHEKMRIDAPIGRNPVKKTRMAITEKGREATTLVNLVKVIAFESQKLSLVDVFPLTGRTHQIRVHLAAMNLPVVGDTIYGRRKTKDYLRSAFGRLMLHAYKITFSHPVTKREMTFEATLPPTFNV